MPGPLVVPLIAAGAALAGQAGDAIATGNMNKKNRAFAREQYQTQKNDNLSQWHMQNDYNSPTSQMKRFQEAGLNPNLIYGQGSGGGGTASPIPTARLERPDTQKISVNPSGAVGTYFDTQMRTAQLDNLKSQNTVLQNEAVLKQVQALGIITGNEQKAFDLDLNKKYSGDMRAEQLENLLINRIYKTTLNDGANQNNQFNLDTFQKRKDSIDYSNQLRKNQAEMQKLELILQKNGISKSDPFYMRMMAQLMGKFGLSMDSLK